MEETKKSKKMSFEEIIEVMIKDRRVRLSIVKRIPKFFFYFYFPHFAKFKIAPLQEEMFHITEDASIRNAVIVGFRGCGKSVILTTSFPLWAILGEQKIKYVLILSQTQEKAQMYLRQIKYELETNEQLKRDLGPFQEEGNQWNTISLYLTRYNAKITAASSEQSIRGLRHMQYRPQLIICDDLEDLESVKTQEGRDKIYNWLLGDVIPSGDRDTRIFIVGGILHEDSLPRRLQRNMAEGKMCGIYREYPFLDENGHPTWPDKFKTPEDIKLERQKIGNEITFQREYMLRPLPDEGQLIPDQWIKYYDVFPDKQSEEKFLFTATGIDLAISEKQTAHFTAMVSARVYRCKNELRIYILPNPINDRLDFPATIKRAKCLSISLGNGIPTYLYVEDVAYQRAFIQQLRQEGFPAEAVAIEGQDKRARVILISPLIQSGQVLFPRYGAELVIKQLIGFGVQRFDDLLDALTILIMQILKRHNSRFCFLRVNGSDFGVTTPSPKDNNLPSEDLKLGLLPEKIELPWKSEEERKKLERELDLEIHRQDINRASRQE